MNLYDDSWMDELAIKARIDKVLRDDMPGEYEREMHELEQQYKQLTAMVRGQQEEIEKLVYHRGILLMACKAGNHMLTHLEDGDLWPHDTKEVETTIAAIRETIAMVEGDEDA